LSNRILRRLRDSVQRFLHLQERLDAIAVLQGRALAQANRREAFTILGDYGFKVFSQWGEDGILQFLIGEVEIANKTFIEFGVEDFTESNCRFLMMNDQWQGFVIDGSARNVARIRSSYYFWRHDLNALAAFITRDNINDLLAQSGMDEDLGILSVDIDGSDYHVLDAIVGYRPRILVCEYNPLFPLDRAVTIPYASDFQRTRVHYSNLYFGASLPAFRALAEGRGYAFVGTNDAGNNAFFVRDDLLTERLRRMAEHPGIAPARFRESRTRDGSLSYLSPPKAKALIAGLPVVDLDTGQLIAL